MTNLSFNKEVRAEKVKHKVLHQESKEFQMKVDLSKLFGKKKLIPGDTDNALFDAIVKTLNDLIPSLSETEKFEVQCTNNLWHREGIRYDTKDHKIISNNLTLAVEATDKLTKLKCKKHSFVPELLYSKVRKSICYPDIATDDVKRSHTVRHKLEQDMHFSNHKYCASGSLFVPGRQTQVESVDFFSKYFPKLKKIATPDSVLQEVSHWDEVIFDDMNTRWDGNDFSTWMLVNRWDWRSKTLIESELSFKVEKEVKEKWDPDELGAANKLYLGLYKSGFFLPAPPIFFYQAPVSSVAIQIA